MTTAKTLDLAAAQAPRLVTEIPGPQARARIERDHKVTSPSLPRAYELVPKRGAGSVIEDVDGNLFLDVNAGIAVTSTGHAHPAVVAAIQGQAEQLLHYSASDFYLPIYSDVCEELDRIAPFAEGARSFLTNSGTEAVEGAIKLARYATGRQNIIAMIGSFHGRSLGSVSLTASKAKYRTGFGPLLPGVYHTVFGDEQHLDILFRRLVAPSEVAAIVVEPILGEGGYVLPPPGWFRYLRELCDRHGIVLVADEVQAGMGRTGKMWAIQHFGVEPDIVLAGKGIASGMPLGAIVARESLMTWDVGAHGSTYGGNPVACAAALATLELIEDGLMDNAREVGELLLRVCAGSRRSGTSRSPMCVGCGLMIGMEFDDAETMHAVEQAAFHKGLLVLGAGDSVIRMSPPLVFRPEQAETALQVFDDAVADVVGG